MIVVYVLLVLAVVTTVHEAGHWLAVRIKGGRVFRVRVGWGTVLFRAERGGTEYILAALPFGGRIHYEPFPSGAANAVVAVSGAVANVAFGFVLLGAGALFLGADGMPYPVHAEHALGYAAETVGLWLGSLPLGIRDLVAHGHAAELHRAIRALWTLLLEGRGEGLLYFGAAVSILWAALNMIPVPGMGTDGWNVIRAFLGERNQ